MKKKSELNYPDELGIGDMEKYDEIKRMKKDDIIVLYIDLCNEVDDIESSHLAANDEMDVMRSSLECIEKELDRARETNRHGIHIVNRLKEKLANATESWLYNESLFNREKEKNNSTKRGVPIESDIKRN